MSLLHALGWVVLAVALVAAWVWAVRRWTRPGPDPSRPLRAICRDGWSLAVYHRAPTERRFVEPVILSHGLAANRYCFDLDPPYSLSAVLADAGFECFVVEWRGTGGSRAAPRGRAPMNYTVDDHIDLDGPAAIELARAETGAPKVFWVGHSLGGLVGYGVAQGPAGDALAGLVTIGSPVALEASVLQRRLLRMALRLSRPWALRHEWLAAGVAPLAGRVPNNFFASALANTNEIEPRIQRQLLAHQIASIGRGVLLQFNDWIQASAFRSVDRQRDFRAGLANVRAPLLCIAGSADFMAPPAAALAAMDLAGSADKTALLFGTPHGHAADYGHADLIFGRCAPAEVYPVVLEWLEARATRTKE